MVNRGLRWLVAWLGVFLGAWHAAGCTLVTDSFVTNGFSGDPFPIGVDTRSGAIIVGLREGGADRRAVLDVLSPVTVVDPGRGVAPTINSSDLVLLGERAGSVGMPDLPRASFDAKQVIRVHPCSQQVDACTVGSTSAASETPFDALIGADVLAGDALRMRLGTDQIFVLADVGGSDHDRTYACDAVFPSPYRGGGTLVIAGTEVAFQGRRVTMQACLGADPDPLITQSARGADVLVVVSTSIGISLLSESAYERYRLARPAAPPLLALAEADVALPSGKIAGRLATIDKLALVARSSSSPRAPCRQFYAHHLMAERDCQASDRDCPCESGDVFCPVPGIVEVAPAVGLDFLIVSDDNATLQALRTELRPDQQEVDGILGTSVLRDVEVDVDYPHNRVLARCTSDACETRPAINDPSDRTQINGCLSAPPLGP